MERRIRRSGHGRPLWWTGLLLAGLVMAPGVILGFLAIRAAGREEAFIEKQLHAALLAEVTPTVERIGRALERVEAELDSTATAVWSGRTAADPADTRSRLAAWQHAQPLVGVPFLFRRSGSFEWPFPASSALTAAETDFLDLNLDFFQDRRSIEVYRSVADEYAERAVRQERLERERPEQATGDARSSPSGAAPPPREGAGGLSEAARRKQARAEFEQDEKVKSSAYEEARRSGRAAAPRNVQSGSRLEQAEQEALPSQFVTESLRFSQIIGERTSGLIPRLVDDRAVLLFWKKVDGNRILGCAVNADSLTARVIAALPAIATPVRVLTVLDHNGRPILSPEPAGARDWRSPFVSREISALLPRWEAAAYLTDPGIISAQARAKTLTVGLLVALLLVSILTGGFVVVRMLRSELRLAEQKTGFVANVSHELKTPLTSIRLFAEMLRDGRQPDPEKQRTYLGIMVSEAERLTRLINNVLDFSRHRRGGRLYTPRPLEMAGLCRELVEIQQVRLRHDGFTVEFVADVPEAWVRADPEAVKQALLNLLSNAEKYSPTEKWIRVAVRRDGSWCVASVADHGAGIPPGQEARIFEEFYRGDDSPTATVRGTGLGLTISRAIARDHGGDLLFVPAGGGDGRGSTFELRLPLAGADGRAEREETP